MFALRIIIFETCTTHTSTMYAMKVFLNTQLTPLKLSGDTCRVCSLEKAHKLPLYGYFEQCDPPGKIVHSGEGDIVGMMQPSYPPDGYGCFAHLPIWTPRRLKIKFLYFDYPAISMFVILWVTTFCHVCGLRTKALSLGSPVGQFHLYWSTMILLLLSGLLCVKVKTGCMYVCTPKLTFIFPYTRKCIGLI